MKEQKPVLKAVLFDMDDTLIDWSSLKTDWTTLEASLLGGVYEYLCAEVHPIETLDAYRAEFHNRSMAAWAAARVTQQAPNIGRVLVESAIALGAPIAKLDMRRVLEEYDWKAVPGTTIFPEVPAVLSRLIAAGIKVGVVTNAYQPMMLREVEMRGLGILDFFPDCRISAADVGYLKPHPEIFHTALRHVNTKPHETVFVGDDPHADIVGAQRIGMKAVLRYIDRRPFESGDDDIQPDAIVKDLNELFPLLDDWYPDWETEHIQENA